MDLFKSWQEVLVKLFPDRLCEFGCIDSSEFSSLVFPTLKMQLEVLAKPTERMSYQRHITKKHRKL